jgi:hypothetical protein
MQLWLSSAIFLGCAVATALTELFFFRVGRPPDAVAAVLGGLWLAMPYLAAAGLAAVFRRHTPALVTLLLTLLIVAPAGLSLFHASATQVEVAEQEARDAVQPGEDPHHGPGGMRQAGADMGAAISWGFSILLAVVVPPVQLAALLLPTLIAWGVTALVRGGEPQREPAGV